MPRDPIPTWAYALIVVRQQGRFLLVRELTRGQLWYLPAGRVEPGETIAAAAQREAQEETGIPVRLDGIVRIEHTPIVQCARLRVIFTASPLDATPPKSVPDEHTLEARWVALEDLPRLPLRSPEVIAILHYVARGGPVYPLSLLTPEGAPFSVPPPPA